MIVKKQQLLITQIKWITMKKIKSIIILSVVIFSAVLYSIEKQWYDKEGHINILKTCAMYSPIGTVGANGQIKANGIDVGYLAYGPYVQLKAGKYAIKYKLILNNLNMDDDSGRVVGYCDVDIEGHPEPAYHIDMTVGDFKKKNPREVMLKFTVPDGLPKVQFRVYQYYGNNHMLLGLKLYPKSLSLLTSLLKNNFLTYNVILFSTIFFIFLCIYFKIWKIYKLKLFFNKYKSFKFDELEEHNNSVSINFIVQLCIISFFTLLSLNAFWMNRMAIPVIPLWQTVFIAIEISVFVLIIRIFNLRLDIKKFDIFDISLFFLVFLFIFYVLIMPSIPSLMPVNFSNDCVTHYSWMDHVYNKRTLNGSEIAFYPFGYHVTTVMLSKLTGIPAVKMMSILLAFVIALSTAITYAIIIRVFNFKNDGKLVALLPIFTFFWVRGYYDFVFNRFFHGSMVFSYLFMVSFFWALIEYKNYPKWFSYLSLNLSAIGLAYSYTSYLPMLVMPLFLTILMEDNRKFTRRLKDLLITILPVVILSIIHLKSKGTSNLGLAVLNHEGYCIKFNFMNFGDFGNNVKGGWFLILSLIGIPVIISGFKKNIAVINFTLSFLLYFFLFYILKHNFGKFSYYQAYKILYFSPYIAVIYIAAVLYFIRKQLIKIFKPFIGEKLHIILFIIWLLIIINKASIVYDMENYRPCYPEMLKESHYLTIDWARKNIKENFDYIYHHPNLGNWMRHGFMKDTLKNITPDEYYYQVFVMPVQKLSDWLNKSKKGRIAVVDDLNTPPLTEKQKRQFEILYQKENSAVIKKI